MPIKYSDMRIWCSKHQHLHVHQCPLMAFIVPGNFHVTGVRFYHELYQTTRNEGLWWNASQLHSLSGSSKKNVLTSHFSLALKVPLNSCLLIISCMWFEPGCLRRLVSPSSFHFGISLFIMWWNKATYGATMHVFSLSHLTIQTFFYFLFRSIISGEVDTKISPIFPVLIE